MSATIETAAKMPMIISDEKAFEHAFKTHFNALHAYAHSILQDQTEAEEIVQNLFMRLWEKRDNLKIDSSLKAYLYRAVHNDSLNHIKHRRVKLQYEQHMSHQPGMEASHASGKVQFTELEQRLQAALNKLPEKCRTIFQLSRFEELRYQQIADKLEISIKTVENQMGKALRIMRTELAEFLVLLCLYMIHFLR